MQGPGSRAKRQRMSQEGEGVAAAAVQYEEVDILTIDAPDTSAPPPPPSRYLALHSL